jgi:ferredoxin
MARKIPVWEPSEASKKAMGEIDGNEYNGLGETELRRPKPFFWHPADEHHWGDMQKHTAQVMFYGDDGPEGMKAFSVDRKPGKYLQRGPAVNDCAATREERTPADWSAVVKEFALANGGDDVGIAALDPNWVFEGYELGLPWIISIAVQHDYDKLKHAPSLPGGDNRAILEIGKQYTRAATASSLIRNFIRSKGYDAQAFEGPRGGALLMIPAAIAGGLGELGKHHSMIHRKFGSNFRLSAVATDMPLLADAPDDFGADEFCTTCQVCTNECPPAAISDSKQMVRGNEKWYVDFEKCMPYFAEARSCGICLAVCPWSRPGIADRLVVKWARRREKKALEKQS